MASLSQPLSLLRRVAPRLSQELLACRAAAPRTYTSAAAGTRSQYKSVVDSPFLRAFRSGGPAKTPAKHTPASPLAALGRRLASHAATAAPVAAPAAAPAKASSFPDVSSKSVAYWLLGSAASVFGIVVFGGLTRLTESGLSITEWRPVTGSLPPMSLEHWESEFAKYRASPEFQQLNSSMTLPEFKKIYWMEWTHRLWGRFIGLTFLFPTIYFIARRRVSKPMAYKLVGICGMIAFQGIIGWWMVASGLKDDLFAPGSHPRVSQYRLTAHLGAAFVVYVSMLLCGLSILRSRRLVSNPSTATTLISTLQSPALRPYRIAVYSLAGLIFTTAMSGALVAGLDAGLIYNEFPWMGLGLTPPKKELFDPWYSHRPDHSDLWWRNMLENPSLVQLDHRILATTTFCAVLALYAATRFHPRLRAALPADARKGTMGLVHLVSLQAALGIATLLYMVPVPLAAAHQAGALALLTGVTVLGSRIWTGRRLVRLVRLAEQGAPVRVAGRPVKAKA